MSANLSSQGASCGGASASRAAAEKGGDRFDATLTLFETTRLMRAAFGQRMQDMGLTGASWRIIFRLSHEDGETQAALARRLDITPVAIGEAVDRLEKSGHVERRADPDDRRKRCVFLTEKAIEQLPAMMAAAETLQTEIFKDVDEAELAQVTGVLGKVRARLQEMKVDAALDTPLEEGDA